MFNLQGQVGQKTRQIAGDEKILQVYSKSSLYAQLLSNKDAYLSLPP
jgi:hypothetical protein